MRSAVKIQPGHIVALIFLICIFFIGTATVLLPDRTRTFFENRVLSQFPKFTGINAIWLGGEGSFFEDMDTYLSDQIVGREFFLTCYVYARNMSGTRLINGVVLGKEGELLPYRKHVPSAYSGDLAENDAAGGEGIPVSSSEDLQHEESLSARADTSVVLSSIMSMREVVEAEGGHLMTVLVPHKRVMQYAHYPDYFQNSPFFVRDYDRTFTSYLQRRGVDCLNLFEVLQNTQGAFFKTDHHLNADGALIAYSAIMSRIENTGVVPLVFEPEDVEKPFLGSYNRKLMGIYPMERAVALIPEGGFPEFYREDNGRAVDYIYKYDSAEDWLTYGLYMGGDIANTVILTDRDLPKLLVVGDSNKNILSPLLAATFGESHFIDMRYFGGSYTAGATDELLLAERQQKGELLLDYIRTHKPDVVILLYTSPIQNMEFEIASGY